MSDANVFSIRVGVSINFLVKSKQSQLKTARILYHRTDELWKKKQKFDFLETRQHVGAVEWQIIKPDARSTWLTEGLHAEFTNFLPMGTQEAKMAKNDTGKAIFSLYSLGIATNRDSLTYAFDLNLLQERVRTFIEIYNTTIDRKRRCKGNAPLESFVDTNDPRIKWTRQVKASLQKLELNEYEDSHFRTSLYRPFSQKFLYFDDFWNEERYQQYRIFPTPETETENRVICAGGYGRIGFSILISKLIPDLNFYGDPQQSFPFFTYDEDGGNRRENITDWALAQFRSHYCDDTITKWDIFYYVYALLHHHEYRDRYAANLKRDLPRIPYAPDFRGFANAGARLAEIHLGYEEVDEYQGGNGAPSLQLIETPDIPLDWCVEKMKLSKDKTQITYNDFLTLDGIPSKTFGYRLGNRSALEWVIDQYRVKTDKRSGIVNDPNRDDDPQYIVKLLRKVITVSLETVEIVEGLPELGVQ